MEPNQRSQFLTEAASGLIVIDQNGTIWMKAVSQQRDDIGMGQAVQDLYPQKKESREFPTHRTDMTIMSHDS